MSNTNMDQEPAEHDAVSPTWPKFLLAVLTLLGVFKGRPLDACRPCYDCRHKRGDGDKSKGRPNDYSSTPVINWYFTEMYLQMFATSQIRLQGSICDVFAKCNGVNFIANVCKYN